MGSLPSEYGSDDTKNLSGTTWIGVVECNLYVTDQAQYLGFAAKPHNETCCFHRKNEDQWIPTPKVIANNEIDLQ